MNEHPRHNEGVNITNNNNMLTQKNPNVAGNIEENYRIMVWALQRHYTQELENMVVSEVNTK